jgi:hypothetical protein
MDPLMGWYPWIATVMSVLIVAVAIYVVVGMRLQHGLAKRASLSDVLASATLAAGVALVLSALRVQGVADAFGTDPEDRVFRIALIALRIYVLGSLLFAAWDLRRMDGE